MAVTFDTTNFNSSITDGTTNSGIPTSEEDKIGIKFFSDADPVPVNKFLFNLSSAIEYIQTNGFILWQKGKQYKLGSIVNIIEKYDDFSTLRKFKCIKVDDVTGYTTEVPVVGSLYLDQDRLTSYFQDITSVNSTYWDEIFDKDDSIISLQLQERSFGLSLFEIPTMGFYRNNFDVLIERYNTNTASNDTLRFTVNFETFDYDGNTDNVILNIYNVNCNNYERSSYVPTANQNGLISSEELNYVFGKNKFTLLGITMSIKNNKLNLDIYSDDFAYIDDTKTINVKLVNNIQEINVSPVILQQYNGFTGKDVVVIRDGYDNSGTDCGYIVETTTKYTTEEMFKNSLLLITTNNCIDPTSRRPGSSRNFDYVFNPDDMINVINDKTNTDYSNHVLPYIYGEARPEANAAFNNSTNGSYYYSSTILSGIEKRPLNRDARSGAGTDTNPIGKTKATISTTNDDITKNIFNSKNPELNIIDSKPALYPKSKRVYRYFKY